MTAEKNQIKAFAAHEIGVRLDDQLDGAVREQAAMAGANQVLLQTAKTIEELLKHVDKDIEEGKYEGLSELQVGAIVKQYVVRSMAVVNSIATQCANKAAVATGKIEAFQAAVKATKTYQGLQNEAASLAEQRERDDQQRAKDQAEVRARNEVAVNEAARMPPIGSNGVRADSVGAHLAARRVPRKTKANAPHS